MVINTIPFAFHVGHLADCSGVHQSRYELEPDFAWVYDGRPAVTLSHETWTNQLSWSYFGCGGVSRWIVSLDSLFEFFLMARDERRQTSIMLVRHT